MALFKRIVTESKVWKFNDPFIYDNKWTITLKFLGLTIMTKDFSLENDVTILTKKEKDAEIVKVKGFN
jgi:hypothetical protein